MFFRVFLCSVQLLHCLVNVTDRVLEVPAPAAVLSEAEGVAKGLVDHQWRSFYWRFSIPTSPESSLSRPPPKSLFRCSGQRAEMISPTAIPIDTAVKRCAAITHGLCGRFSNMTIASVILAKRCALRLNPKLSAHQTDQEEEQDERQGIRRKVTANQADECAQGCSGEPFH